jgi:hypothetical protein
MEAFADVTLIEVTTGGGGGGGGAVTLSETVALTFWALAVIWVEPAAIAVATPSFLPSELTAVTEAAFGLELDHVNTIPDIALPYWSNPTAPNSWVLPAWSDALVGDTLIEVKTEAGLLTVRTAELLLRPNADAVICTVPAPTPFARPALLTGATFVFVLDHANVIPLMAAPFWS